MNIQTDDEYFNESKKVIHQFCEDMIKVCRSEGLDTPWKIRQHFARGREAISDEKWGKVELYISGGPEKVMESLPD